MRNHNRWETLFSKNSKFQFRVVRNALCSQNNICMRWKKSRAQTKGTMVANQPTEGLVASTAFPKLEAEYSCRFTEKKVPRILKRLGCLFTYLTEQASAYLDKPKVEHWQFYLVYSSNMRTHKNDHWKSDKNSGCEARRVCDRGKKGRLRES